MRRAAVLFAIVTTCGCQSGRTEGQGQAGVARPTAAIVDRVWTRSDSTGLPGVMRIFLSDGTLVMRVELVNGSQEERYQPAAVPYLCPDMRR